MTPSIGTAAELAKVAVETVNGVTTVIGGAHASIVPVETLQRYPQFSAAVCGEGEVAFLALCKELLNGKLAGEIEIPSVIARSRDGGIVGNPSDRQPPVDLDSLPLPARELLDFNAYRGAPTPGISCDGTRATQLFTARGCPGRCIFCCSEHVFGRRVRTRSVEHVMEEVRDCVSRFGFRHFTIDNDTFTYDREYVLRFCDEIAALGVTWDCDTRVDRVDSEILKRMESAGCVKVAYGVETGSDKVLKLIRKGITHEQVRTAFRMTREAGMMSCAFLMVGNHPEETEEDIAATARFVREIRPDLISVAVASPYPGTTLREEMLREGLLSD